MLHRINPPDCGDRLDRIVQFQFKVLTFVCNPLTTLPLIEKYILAEFGPAGDWFWNKLWVKRKSGLIGKSKLHKALEKAIRYVQKRPKDVPLIIDAFNHDIDFPNHLNDPNFQFSYTVQLSKSAQKAIRGFLQSFYSELLASGFPTSVQGHADNFNRDTFVSSFYSANPELYVCPACDGPRAETIDIKTYADADHFFPKSKYPFFSVLRANLVPLCIYCNRSFKLDRDPIDVPNDSPLTNTFHPYGNPAIRHIDVEVTRNAVGALEVMIKDKTGMPSRRVDNLNRVFMLEKRWVGRLPILIEIIRTDLAKQGRRRRERAEPLSEEVISGELTVYPDEYEQDLGKRPNHVLQSSYLNYAANNRDEFEELLRYLQEE